MNCPTQKSRTVIGVTQPVVWALARAPDLHWNGHQLIKSSNNGIHHPIKVPRRNHIPDELAARALNKDTWNVTVPDSPDSLSTIQK